MKIITEISGSEEIIIKAPKERLDILRSAVEEVLKGENEITLVSAGTEYFVPKNEILYFESSNGKVYAHTSQAMYTAPYKLFELETMMPSYFVRVSKSVIANIGRIASMRRELVGNGELTFRGCEKKVYFSRAYFKLLQYKIDEMRLNK